VFRIQYVSWLAVRFPVCFLSPWWKQWHDLHSRNNYANKSQWSYFHEYRVCRKMFQTQNLHIYSRQLFVTPARTTTVAENQSFPKERKREAIMRRWWNAGNFWVEKSKGGGPIKALDRAWGTDCKTNCWRAHYQHYCIIFRKWVQLTALYLWCYLWCGKKRLN
jgi:hypothetical protein